MSIFKTEMPVQPPLGRHRAVEGATPPAFHDERASLNSAFAVHPILTPDDALATSAAFYPKYTAMSTFNRPCRHGRGKHY
jgi:hypothetical protein